MTNIRNFIFAVLVILALPAMADVTYVVSGVNEVLQANVLAHVDVIQFGPRARLRPRDHDEVIGKAISDARAALRPFGYYAPEISGRIIVSEDGPAVVELTIDLGPPIRIESVDVRLAGPGEQERQFQTWLRAWPLRKGDVLNQPAWDDYQQDAIEIANASGYLGAEFSEHAIEIDLEQNTASLKLVLDTGPRYLMGDVSFGDHGLKPGILEYVPRFDKGDPYTARLVSRFRTDLWKTGFFDDVTVQEIERPDQDSPEVDFDVHVKTETRNHYSGALGWGNETGIRLQANYSRHPMSSYGDRLDVGIGYQELNDQLTLRSRYRKPLLNRARQWWDAELTLRIENLDLEIKRDQEDERFNQDRER